MSDYRCYAFRNYEISKEEYNYLLPIYGRCAFDNGFPKVCGNPFIIEREERYFFCGTTQDYKEMKERCKYI